MNELTKKLQQVMVPKAALIAYEYSDGRYGHGTYYLELHPINDRGRMEAAVPVTYEFMDSLVEYYTDNRQDVPHGKIPANMLWCGAIVYSTLATKQHVVLDVVGGLALGAAAGWASARLADYHQRQAISSEQTTHA